MSHAWKAAAASTMLVLWASTAAAQTCLHGSEETSSQRARREAAIRYVEQVNAAQETLRDELGVSGRLDELPRIDGPPVGFVVLLTVDDYNYAITLKDVLDPCRYAVFSDSHGIIYEAAPLLDSESAMAAAVPPLPKFEPSK